MTFGHRLDFFRGNLPHQQVFHHGHILYLTQGTVVVAEDVAAAFLLLDFLVVAVVEVFVAVVLAVAEIAEHQSNVSLIAALLKMLQPVVLQFD